MSVTFISDAICARIRIREACLCAQMAPDFLRAAPEVLAAHAERSCTWCRGSGLTEREERDEPALNVSNVNAHALLAFLRLIDDRMYLQREVPSLGSASAGAPPPTAPYELSGQVELPRMRRALLQARNTFRTRSPYFVRPTEVLRSARRQNDGTTALVERVLSGGLSAERLAQYVASLERLCASAQAHQGTRILWD